MPGAADTVQRAVHALETGQLAGWIRRVFAVVVVVTVALIYLYHFRGLATSQAMDQAQIGRHIASGQGWKTGFVRPRAVAQLQAHGKSVPDRIWFDTYNAPLPPLFDAATLAHYFRTLDFSLGERQVAGLLEFSGRAASVGAITGPITPRFAAV